MARQRYHHGDLREALLDAAEALVRERGAGGWSLREASARVGVSPSAAYHHFASRDALVHALFERVLARVGERLTHAAAHARPSDDPQRRLVAVARGYVHWTLENPAVARLVFDAGSTDPAAAITPHPHDVLTAELDRLVAAGGLPHTARQGAEFVVWAALHGLARLLVDGLIQLESQRAVDRQAERLLRAVLTGLAHEEAADWPAVRSAHTERLNRRPSGISRG